MRAVHVVRQFAPSVGGLEEAVLKLCQALAARGVTPRVVTLDRVSSGAVAGRLAAEDWVEGIPVRRIPFRGSSRYPLAPGVLGCIADADVVHVHGIDFFFDFLAATRPLHGKPLVASTHGGFFHTAFARRLKQAYFHSVTRAAALAYAAICASSESDVALFRPITRRNLTLAVNGVDVDKWSGRASPHPVRHMLYIGRFSTNKNLAALFPLLRALLRLDPDWRLTIAGQPWDVSAASLQSEAEREGFGPAVTILAAPSDAAIARAVGEASYIVSASRHEGFGISAVEGLSAGLVPVLNRIPAFAKLVAEARCGLLADFSDPIGSSVAIEALHRTVSQQPEHSRAVAMAAAVGYSWDGAADTVLRCYQRALGSRPLPLPNTAMPTHP